MQNKKQHKKALCVSIGIMYPMLQVTRTQFLVGLWQKYKYKRYYYICVHTFCVCVCICVVFPYLHRKKFKNFVIWVRESYCCRTKALLPPH